MCNVSDLKKIIQNWNAIDARPPPPNPVYHLNLSRRNNATCSTHLDRRIPQQNFENSQNTSLRTQQGKESKYTTHSHSVVTRVLRLGREPINLPAGVAEDHRLGDWCHGPGQLLLDFQPNGVNYVHHQAQAQCCTFFKMQTKIIIQFKTRFGQYML